MPVTNEETLSASSADEAIFADQYFRKRISRNDQQIAVCELRLFIMEYVPRLLTRPFSAHSSPPEQAHEYDIPCMTDPWPGVVSETSSYLSTKSTPPSPMGPWSPDQLYETCIGCGLQSWKGLPSDFPYGNMTSSGIRTTRPRKTELASPDKVPWPIRIQSITDATTPFSAYEEADKSQVPAHWQSPRFFQGKKVTYRHTGKCYCGQTARIFTIEEPGTYLAKMVWFHAEDNVHVDAFLM